VTHFLAAALAVSFWVTTPSVGPAPNYHQPDGLIAESVNCDQWERVDSETWRAEGKAVVKFYDEPDIVLHRIDVTQTFADDLFWTIEDACNEEAYGALYDDE